METGTVCVNGSCCNISVLCLQLNFLYEAEMMKRFHHDNIVKLLGVCTRGEPAYTIMEFMLHGEYRGEKLMPHPVLFSSML